MMQSTLAASLADQSAWRAALDRGVTSFARLLSDHGLLEKADAAHLDALRERLLADKLTVAFVAEFSRGKSELINAIFFADTGRRILPATPGRTTMCPVELFHDAESKPSLSLLPIETRLRGLSLAELRNREEHWRRVPLNPNQPEALANALASVTKTQRVSIEMATKLGFWHESQPDDNPHVEADGTVEVPAWRHALINYPHPLLQRGLVVIDTPGLNAIGAEPELTLGLLPAAHATVFILSADAGVTRSDLSVWREHLSGDALERFVVLNKIDALDDPLLSTETVQKQIERQCQVTAETLGLPRGRIFPISARDALSARLSGDAKALTGSRLPEFEVALMAELLPRQAELIATTAVATVRMLRETGTRRINDRRRQLAEQTLELRGLRGKSGAKVRLMLQRLDGEAAEFERCTGKLAALRSVLSRQLNDALALLSSESLRTEVRAMHGAANASLLKLGARKAFTTLFDRLRASMQGAQDLSHEMASMLEGSFDQLNAEYGFAFSLTPPPNLAAFRAELDLIDKRYGSYVSLSQAWRMAQPGFMEQFRRMLLSKLRVVFENAAGAIELWSKEASAQVDGQLRDRRRAFQRRRDALERIQSASSELEQRIAEVEAMDERLREQQQRMDESASETMAVARDIVVPTRRAHVA